MGQIMKVQSKRAMSMLITNVERDRETVELQDLIIRRSKDTGQCFTFCFKGGIRLLTGKLKSIRTKQFNPIEQLGQGWAVWKGPIGGHGLSGEEDIDSRTMNLSEVKLSGILFKAYAHEDGCLSAGEDKLCRLKEERPDCIRFGGNVLLGLWSDYQTDKESSILELLYRTMNVTCVDFLGQILRSPDSHRSSLFMKREKDKWYWDYHWLGIDRISINWNVGCLSAGYIVR